MGIVRLAAVDRVGTKGHRVAGLERGSHCPAFVDGVWIEPGLAAQMTLAADEVDGVVSRRGVAQRGAPAESVGRARRVSAMPRYLLV